MGLFDFFKSKNKTEAVPSDLKGITNKQQPPKMKSIINEIKPNEYTTVKIGNQKWMPQNLNINFFRNGDLIAEAKTEKEWAKAGMLGDPAWCYYNNDPSNGNIYGKLYNWHAVNDILEERGLAPEGWHIPTNEEWTILTDYLGGEDIAGGKLKEVGTTHWNSPNTDATNKSCFTALPGGNRSPDGHFTDIGDSGYWWSADELTNNPLQTRTMHNNCCNVLIGNQHKSNGFSIRCIKD
jgi:uncharacterized protein (TIGR02145 family)